MSALLGAALMAFFEPAYGIAIILLAHTLQFRAH